MMVWVLRLGHRRGRDKRISTHVGLVARAFGASGIVYVGDVEDEVLESVRRVVESWGGPFGVARVESYRRFMDLWRGGGGIIVHLTMYGENIQDSDVLERIRKHERILAVVGASKVPRDVYDLADYNVAIGNQPHSEVAALAVFLDRLFEGRELVKEFIGARLKIVPCKRGKRVVVLR